MDFDEHPIDTMTVGDARIIWLTTLGSGWVDEDILINEPFGSVLDVAGSILDYEALLEYDPHNYKLRLRCK